MLLCIKIHAQYINMDEKRNPQQTVSYDKLPRIRLTGHAGMKPRLSTIDATPVLIRFAVKQCG